MEVIMVLATVFLAGCIGGVVNSLISGGFALPKIEAEANVWRPGWAGNLVTGGIAAIVFWGLYGPFANSILVGSAIGLTGGTPVALKVGEFCGALVTGIGGGRLLTSEVDKLILRKEKDELSKTRDKLATAAANLAKRHL